MSGHIYLHNVQAGPLMSDCVNRLLPSRFTFKRKKNVLTLGCPTRLSFELGRIFFFSYNTDNKDLLNKI